MPASRKLHIGIIVAFLLLIGVVAPSQIVLDLREGERPGILDLFEQTPTRANRKRLESNLENGCRLAQAVRPWVQSARFIALQDAGDKALVGREGWFFYRPAVQYLIEPPPSGKTQGDVLEAITSFRDDLAKRDIKLLVMIAPNKASVYPDMLTTRADGPVNPETRDVLARLKEAGVEVVDLFDLYAGARSQSDSVEYYLAQDSHWSPEGMRLAADAVARRLLDLAWVEKGRTRYETRPVVVERHGDVLRMMRMPQVERRFEPQRMNCTRVVDVQTGQPYKDDPSSPVLILGDSFLGIFERDEPGSGGFIAHLAHNLGLPLASLVNDGGASTLVRQQLARKPALLEGKKIVIWEFVERDIRFGTEGWQIVRLP